MRRLLVPLALGVMVSAGVRLRAADDLVLTRFGDYLEALRTQAGIPGLAATIVGPTDIAWERTFGHQNVERAIGVQANTPFHTDALTQIATATIILRCVEEGKLSLDDTVATFAPTAPDSAATVRQLLTQTTNGPDGPKFTYRLERLDPLAAAAAACTGGSFVRAMASLLDRQAMFDSVPGVDALQMTDTEKFPETWIARYQSALDRLARTYSIDKKGRASVSPSPATTLTARSGLVSTARDLAQFDLALKRGVLLKDDTVVSAWTPPLARNGQRLPHGMGWFVQSYRGEPVVWQFGVSENVSSSMIIMLPRRGLTLILLANSDGLVRPFALAEGDVAVSPFAKLFLAGFVR
jgi:CubicO group peptidase (beta-lactamase class C family)